MNTDFSKASEDEFRSSCSFNEEPSNKDDGVSMDTLAKTSHQQHLDQFEPFLSLTKSLDEARKLNQELNNLLHLKNEEIGKKHHYIERLHAHTEWLQGINQNLICQTQELSWQTQQLEIKINELQKNPIWKITIPLRFISKISGKIAYYLRTIPLKLKSYIRLLFVHGILYIRCRPKLKRFAVKIISCFPRIRSRLSVVIPNKNQAVSQLQKSPFAIDNLNPRAKNIYDKLTAANENEQKDF